MFRTHLPDHMRPEPTPERVYAIIQYLLRKEHAKRDELYQWFCRPHPNEDMMDIFNPTIEVCKELGILREEESEMRILVSPEIIDTIDNFRYYTAQVVFKRPSGLFYNTTQAYMDKSSQVRHAVNLDEIYRLLRGYNSVTEHLTDNDIKGWRFWLAFLGLGYLSGSQQNIIIPNAYRRVRECFLRRRFTTDVLSIDDFLDVLDAECPELKITHNETTISSVLAIALISLEGIGAIELLSVPDAKKWVMTSDTMDGTRAVSHMKLAKDVIG